MLEVYFSLAGVEGCAESDSDRVLMVELVVEVSDSEQGNSDAAFFSVEEREEAFFFS